MRVLLFARVRELVGGHEAVTLDLPPGATVGMLRTALIAQWPGLTALVPRCRIAVQHEFADDDVVIDPEAEVAVIPPVSGG